MANQPTIVAASLDTAQLEKSINAIVKTVEDKTNAMAQNFTTKIGEMQQALNNLGLKGSGGSSGTSKQVSEMKDLEVQTKKTTEAVKEQKATLDQMAQAQKKAIDVTHPTVRPETAEKSARDSYLAFMQGYKQQGEAIARQIREAEEALNRAVSKRVEDLTAKLALAQEKLRGLESHLQYAVGHQNTANPYDNPDLKRTQQQIEYTKARIAELNKEIANAPNMFQGQVQQIEQLRQKHEQVANSMKDNTTATKEQVSVEQRNTEELNKQLQIVNDIKGKKDANKAFEQISLMPSNTMEEIKAKGESLYALIQKVKDTPLMSQSNVKLAEKMLGSLVNQYQALKFEKEQAASAGTQETQKEATAVKKEEENVEELRKKWEQLKQERLAAGLEAQTKSFGTRESIYSQYETANYTEQINGVKDLQQELGAMQRALEILKKDGSQPMLQESLEKDIAKTKELIDATQRYNTLVAGLGSIGGNAPKDTINQYNAEIERLTGIFNNLSRAEREAASGKGLIEKVQTLKKEVGDAQKQLSRPISLEDAFKGSEKTLDDIQYKMQRIQAYKLGINFTTPEGIAEMQKADDKLKQLQQDADKWMGKQKEMTEQNNVFGRSWAYMKNRLAFYLTVGASTQFVKQLIDIRGQYELLERSIGILIDSAQNGSRIFAELNSMALKSPFTTMELGAAAKQLVAYDVAAKDVVDTTKRLADMAAAVGVPIERLTYALGQIKSYNYLNARDARMFANTGIPLVKELADMYTKLEGQLVSTADVYDRIKKKAVSYEDVMRVVNEMTDEGGKFFNFQEKAADTLKVKIANLTLAWNNMLNEIGKDQDWALRGLLGGTKTLMENWRSIYNVLLTLPAAIGLAKLAQIAWYGWVVKTNAATAIARSGLSDIARKLSTMKAGFEAAITPAGAVAAAVAAIAAVLIKLGWDYYDLQKKNEEFNKSIVDGAEENIKSIEKFFKDYKNELASIGGADKSDQQKMWERVQDEIEKTIKNAQQYLDVLNEIQDVAERITAGKAILQQQEEIEQAAKDIASKGLFDTGGGFADKGLGKDLKEYETALQLVIKKWGTLDDIENKASTSGGTFDRRQTAAGRYKGALKEVEEELDNFISKLDAANINKIMGSGNAQTQYANIRNFATIIRDAFLATEEGSKVGAEGQARMNAALDEWITKQGVANNLIKEREINGHKYTAAQIANIEKERTAWEKFFDRISSKDRETLDYAIDTNQMGSGEVKEIWDKATKEMKENERTAYKSIESHIQALRDTPDIVLNIIYRESYEKSTDKQIQEYTDKYLTPSGTGVITPTEYAKQKNELTKKYGKFIKKEGEDNVEWEKRLGQTYEDNRKSIESLNAQLKNSANLSEIDKAAKEDELKTLTDQQTVLDQIKKDQNFNYDQFNKSKNKNKNSKDLVLDALKEEVRLVEKLQGDYDKLTKSGSSQAEALATISKAYGKTINQLNAQLGSYGLPKLTTQLITGKNPHKALQYFQDTLNNLVSRGMMTLERSKELEGVIEKFTLSAKTYDLEKITKGLNNELDKLKDEYELALELDANPELGSLFMDLFDIDPNALPQNIDQYAARVTDALNKSLKDEFKENLQLSSIFLSDDQMKELEEKSLAGEFSSAAFAEIKKKSDEIKKLRQDNAKDTLKKTQDLQYKLADVNGKIAIEEEKLQNLIMKGYRATTEEERNLIDLQVQEQRNVIAKLGEEVMQMLPTYKALFGSIADHSAGVTRRIAKQWKDALKAATKNPDGTYTITDPRSRQKATVSRKEYGNQIDKVNGKLRETQSVYKKLKEAFTKGEDEEVDVAKGIELIGEEAKKAADGLRTVADIVSQLGGSDDAVETINDVATSMEGLGTAAQGYAKIQSGDIIGGVSDMIKGTWSAISTWFDNSDKKISSEIARSEREVKKLELAYIDLEHAVEDAYGMETIGAKRVAAANKELQLAELKRQLTLEQSRKKKNQDQDRIIELQKSIRELEYEIKGMTDEIVNDLLGISSVGDAMSSLMDSFVEALREGEDAMEVFDDSIDNMIANMVKKMFTTKILAPWFEEQWNTIQKELEQRAGVLPENISKLTSQVDAAKRVDYSNRDSVWNALVAMGVTGQQIHDYETFDEAGNVIRDSAERFERRKKLYAQMLEQKEKELDAAQREYTQVTTPTQNDIKRYAELLRSGQPIMKENMKDLEDFLRELGLLKDSKDKTLSNLQQGIQGITEDTAGALEAITNGMYQQCMLQSDILQQINTTIQSFDLDVQTASLSMILLQLQSSYQIHQSVLNIMQGWSNPSGSAVKVELVS